MSALRGLETIRKAVQQRPEELARARKSGEQVVGYICCYTPEEIIHD